MTLNRLVGFGFNGFLGQYFSLYGAISQREGEREEKGKMIVKMAKHIHPHPRLAGKYRWREFPAVITILGNTPNFCKVGNTGKYEILGLFELKYSAIVP